MPILHWLTRDADLEAARKVPYRVLEEDESLSYGIEQSQGNMIIQGDNLEALKALLPFYAGQVKCIYIDPPYNTKSAFEHYDDNLEHTKWLEMIVPRLMLLREFLSEAGSIWVSIDDNEAHYLKVIMDEIFGRKNFIANVVWQKRTSPDARINLGGAHDHIVVYGKEHSKARETFNLLGLTEEQKKQYKNPDNDPLGPWVSTDFTAQGFRPNQMYELTTPGGVKYTPPEGRCWANIEDVFDDLVDKGKMWFGKNQNARPRVKNHLRNAKGVKSWSWWANKDVGHNQEGKKEINALFGAANAFDTPKPERLIERILHIASNPGDLIMDTFLGSGTTAAVAHKMGRRYIGVEMGDHARTHCAVRQQKVIDGEQGGISEAVNWQGGGGYRFFTLGAPVYDQDGHICPDITFENLAAHIWFSETDHAWHKPTSLNTVLGVQGETAYALLYNGILGDRKPQGGNVLTTKTLKVIRDDLAKTHPDFAGQLVIYGESSRLRGPRLDAEKIIFKQTPYDVKAR